MICRSPLRGATTCNRQCTNFWLAAPEGFSATFPHPAHTCPGLSERFGRLLVSIIAFKKVLLLYHRKKRLSSAFGYHFVIQMYEIGQMKLLYQAIEGDA